MNRMLPEQLITYSYLNLNKQNVLSITNQNDKNFSPQNAFCKIYECHPWANGLNQVYVSNFLETWGMTLTHWPLANLNAILGTKFSK